MALHQAQRSNTLRMPRPSQGRPSNRRPSGGARGGPLEGNRVAALRPWATDVVLVMLAGAAGGLVAVGAELALMPRSSVPDAQLLERAAAISSASLPPVRNAE
jgi:hypothetical protein